MKAKKAKKIAKKQSKILNKIQLSKVLLDIEKNSHKGYSGVYFPEQINTKVERKLKKLGYNVNFPKPIGIYKIATLITWIR